ncbi:hypothetical protein MHK_004180, partial [Candidatus Magnetomorum sp. HK-1]
ILLVISFFPLIMGNENCQVQQQLLDMLNQKIKPPTGQNSIYISHLTFMDPTTGTSIFQTEAGKLINDAVINGINQAQKKNPSFQHNAAGHVLEDTDANVNKLVNITFDPNINKGDKISRIISELMDPAKIDVIVTGQYFEKGPIVDVRPLIIVKKELKIITKVAQYKKSEFLCSDPVNPSTKALCQGARDEISKLVKELLEQI